MSEKMKPRRLSRRRFGVNMLKGMAGITFIGVLNPVKADYHYYEDGYCGLLPDYEYAGHAQHDATCGGEDESGEFDHDDASCGLYISPDDDSKQDGDSDCGSWDGEGENTVYYTDSSCNVGELEDIYNWDSEDGSCGKKCYNPEGDPEYDNADDSCATALGDPLPGTEVYETDPDDDCSIIGGQVKYFIEIAVLRRKNTSSRWLPRCVI